MNVEQQNRWKDSIAPIIFGLGVVAEERDRINFVAAVDSENDEDSIPLIGLFEGDERMYVNFTAICVAFSAPTNTATDEEIHDATRDAAIAATCAVVDGAVKRFRGDVFVPASIVKETGAFQCYHGKIDEMTAAVEFEKGVHDATSA